MTNAPIYPRTGTLNFFDTHIGVWEEHVDDAAMLDVFLKIRAHLESRGWTLTSDPMWDSIIERPWKKRMRKDERARQAAHVAEARERARVGRKGDLELKADLHGRAIKIDFFQNVVVENPNGGQYDFGKFARMPRLIRTLYLVEVIALIRFLQGLGYSFSGDLREPLASTVLRICEGRAEDGLSPLEQFNRGWGADRFTRGPDGWPLPKDCSGTGGPCKDRDGAVIAPGVECCTYDYHRNLIQGRAYPHMNGMWWIHDATGGRLANVYCNELFSLAGTMPPRRKPLGSEKQIARLRREMDAATRSGDATRAGRIRKTLVRLGADMGEQMYYLLSIAHTRKEDRILTWWGPDDSGYVFRLEQAGKYPEHTVRADPHRYDGDRTRAVPVEVVERMGITVADVDPRCREVNRDVRPTEHVVEYARMKGLIANGRAREQAADTAQGTAA